MITLPTLAQLYAGIISDLETQYGANISVIGKVALRAIGAVQAAKLKLFYLAVGNLQKNIFVDTAEPESIGGTLERFGRVKLGRNPFPAVAGKYVLQVTGTAGATIVGGTIFKSDDSSLNPGMLYILDADYILVSSPDSITVRALVAGEVSKLSPADTLTATAPIALVSSAAVVLSEFVQPLNAEDIEAYRSATILSYRIEAEGGAGGDYRLWAQDTQAVRFVYPYVKSGVTNEINLFIEATAADSTDGYGTPSAQTITDVEAVVELNPDTSLPINDRGRRPIGVFAIHYLPVTIKTIDINIASAVGFTPDIKAQLLIALTDALFVTRPFIASSDVLANKNDILDTNKLIGIIIQTIPGAIFGAVTFTVNGVTLGTYTFLNGDIPHLNSVTYV